MVLYMVYTEQHIHVTLKYEYYFCTISELYLVYSDFESIQIA